MKKCDICQKEYKEITTLLKERIELKEQIDKLNKISNVYNRNFEKLSNKFEKILALTKTVDISKTMESLENVLNSLDKVAETLEKNELIEDKKEIIDIEKLKKLQQLESSKLNIK